MKKTNVKRDEEGNFVLKNSLDAISEEEDGSSESESGSSSYYYSEEDSEIIKSKPNTQSIENY
jgi:hypothetical protein